MKSARPKSHLGAYLNLFLLLATFAAYAQVFQHDFVNYDDPDYVSENAHVRAGLTSAGLRWAFTSGDDANWLPLTRLSHMLDAQLFGLSSGFHHLINVLLHALSTLLLFAVLQRTTGALWRSASVAFLFALHPLHVESVAWIAERKDVLSAFFWFLTLWAYVRYVEQPGPRRYCLTLAAFALGAMSKPMIVTLPFVLLLLDVWPLRRRPSARLLLEKVPLFAMSIVFSLVTYIVQHRGGSVIALDSLPITTRVSNALVSYVAYLGQMLWPMRLAAFYPLPADIPVWQVLAAAAVLLGITFLVVRLLRSYPYLAVGWFWYLGTLVPVIGLVQVGTQSRADRYTYIPLVGIFILIAWGVADVSKRWPKAKPTLIGVYAIACAACFMVTWFQIGYWRNSEALFEHAIRVTSGNYIAYNGLGIALRHQDRFEAAGANYDQAINIRPQFPDAHTNLADVLLLQGHPEDAIPHLLIALRIKPDSAEAHVNLGAALNKLGRHAESIAQYREALRLQPDNAVAHGGLGGSLADAGQTSEALREMLEAVRINPDYADGHNDLGILLGTLGRTDEAVVQFTEAVRLRPDDSEAHYNLGTAFGAQGRLSEAMDQFNIALRLNPSYANAHLNLGKALANAGRMDEAIVQLSEAVRLDPNLTEAQEALKSMR
jgi:tetratricopeptide (TPR) repeat protein